MEKKKQAKKAAKKTAVQKTSTKSASVKKTAAKKVATPKPKKTAVPKARSVKTRSLKTKITKKPMPSVSPATRVTQDLVQPSVRSAVPARPETSQSVYWQDRYEDNRIVLMIRDPYWCFVYWDLSPDKQTEAIQETQNSGANLTLRVYDVTDLVFDGTNAHRTLDSEVSAEATNWYINVWAADRSYCVDLGLRYPDGRFSTLARSNVVTTPRDSVSPLVDEEWMVVDETFDRLYRTAGAAELGQSSEAITKYMLKRVRAEAGSGGLASMGSEGGRPRPRKAKEFWLVVNAEVIVYGATEPDAIVTIQGQPLKLNHDGSFSVRYALPDGKQTIAVKSANAEGTQERQVTPIIEKRTE